MPDEEEDFIVSDYRTFVSFFRSHQCEVSRGFHPEACDTYHIMAVDLKSNKHMAVTSNFDTPGTLCPGWALMLPEQPFDCPAFLSLARTQAGKGKVRSYICSCNFQRR